jgi:minor extracellular serine protease Vpr
VRDIGDGLMQFGIDTYGVRSHPNYPAEFDIWIDSNNDGTPDYVVFNNELGGFGTSGQNVVNVFSFATGKTTPVFFDAADLDSGNAIFTIPMSAVGLSESTKFSFVIQAIDNYFTGSITDSIGDVVADADGNPVFQGAMAYTLGTPRFQLSGLSFSVPAGGKGAVTAAAVAGGDQASPSQLGFQFLYSDAATSGGNDPSKDEGQAVLVKP